MGTKQALSVDPKKIIKNLDTFLVCDKAIFKYKNDDYHLLSSFSQRIEFLFYVDPTFLFFIKTI